MTHNMFFQKVKITGKLTFHTAFHIGSGKEGELSTHMGILLDPDGKPILPGSTLKGNFRSFAERLAPYLKMTACLLDTTLSAVDCVSDEVYRKTNQDAFKRLSSERDKLNWLDVRTCDVCKLFGSPMMASRIFFSDGILVDGGDAIGIRDGVCIDRDTETARPKAKFDYEVVPAGAVFQTTIEIENPEDDELALIAAVVGEWENGFRLGGFSSRGLGRVTFTDKKIESVDYTKPAQLIGYLVGNKMTPTLDLLTKSLESKLNRMTV